MNMVGKAVDVGRVHVRKTRKDLQNYSTNTKIINFTKIETVVFFKVMMKRTEKK